MKFHGGGGQEWFSGGGMNLFHGGGHESFLVITWVQNFMILLSSGCSAFINKWHISDHSIYWMLVEVVISIQFFWCPPHVGDVL